MRWELGIHTIPSCNLLPRYNGERGLAGELFVLENGKRVSAEGYEKVTRDARFCTRLKGIACTSIKDVQIRSCLGNLKQYPLYSFILSASISQRMRRHIELAVINNKIINFVDGFIHGHNWIVMRW